MDTLDDGLKGRKFDNVNFVELSKVSQRASDEKIGFASALALECLAELPDAFKACQKLGYFSGRKW